MKAPAGIAPTTAGTGRHGDGQGDRPRDLVNAYAAMGAVCAQGRQEEQLSDEMKKMSADERKAFIEKKVGSGGDSEADDERSEAAGAVHPGGAQEAGQAGTRLRRRREGHAPEEGAKKGIEYGAAKRGSKRDPDRKTFLAARAAGVRAALLLGRRQRACLPKRRLPDRHPHPALGGRGWRVRMERFRVKLGRAQQSNFARLRAAVRSLRKGGVRPMVYEPGHDRTEVAEHWEEHKVFRALDPGEEGFDPKGEVLRLDMFH